MTFVISQVKFPLSEPRPVVLAPGPPIATQLALAWAAARTKRIKNPKVLIAASHPVQNIAFYGT